MPSIHSLRGALLGATFLLSSLIFAASAEEGPTVHQVVIEGFAFTPPVLTIAQGDSVEWINRDIVPHTATDDDTTWDSGNLDSGQAGRVVFDTVGTHRYLCVYHPVMQGRIVVTAP